MAEVETVLRREAERRHPNHTYARGKFIEGGRYQAEQPWTITTEQRAYALKWVGSYIGDKSLIEQVLVLDAVLVSLGIKVVE